MLYPDVNKEKMICLTGITQSYLTRTATHTVLHRVSLCIPSGQSCSITGASGSGKSTLLSIIGLLDEPTAGDIVLAGHNMTGTSADYRAIVRNRLIGFVFQSFNLLPRLDALNNVALPLMYRGISRQAALDAAKIQLELVGLADRIYFLPADLSGGQRQRVAIARALIGGPALLLADEPTGNLDHDTAQDIVSLLLSLNEIAGTTLVMVTHDEKIAERMDRRIRIRDGHIVGDRYAAR